MEKMNKNGLNLTEEKVMQLKNIFPESISDGKIDFDKLRLLLGDEIDGGGGRKIPIHLEW